MSEVNATPFTITITLRGEDKTKPPLLLEGALDVADQQEAAALKQLIGDGLATVTASKELSHKDYGNGGSVFVSITLTCDQTQATIDTAVNWANYFVEKHVVEQHTKLQQTLAQLGIVS